RHLGRGRPAFEVVGGRLVGDAHELGRPGEVVVAHGRRLPGREQVDVDVVGHGGQLPLEAVVAGDPVRLDGHVERAPGLGPGAREGADLQDVDGPGAQLDGPAHRHVVDDGAVQVAHAVDLDRRVDGGQRGGGEDGLDQRPAV